MKRQIVLTKYGKYLLSVLFHGVKVMMLFFALAAVPLVSRGSVFEGVKKARKIASNHPETYVQFLLYGERLSID